MAGLNNTKMSVKLPALILILVLAAVAATGFLADTNIRKVSREQVRERLGVAADWKSREIESWYRRLSENVKSESTSKQTLSSARLLLRNYAALPAENRSGYLRKHYFTDNPHPEDKKHLLSFVNDGSAYSTAHSKVHKAFVGFMERNGFADVLLLSPEGEIFYTVAKGSELGKNVALPEFSDSPLRQIHSALRTEGGKVSKFVDFEPDADGGRRPGYLGRKIVGRSGKVVAILVVRLRIDVLQSVLAHPAGLPSGATAHLVSAQNGLHLSVGDTTNQESPPPDTQGILARITDDGGNGEAVSAQSSAPYDMAFQKISRPRAGWVLAVTIPRSVTMAAASAMLTDLLMQIAIACAVITVVASLVARSFSLPLKRVASQINDVSAERLDIEISDRQRGDEIGKIASALEDLRLRQIDTQAVARDNIFKGAAFAGSSAAMMMVNNEFCVTYINGAMRHILTAHREEFRKVEPSFDPETIEGQCLDMFHLDKAAVRKAVRSAEIRPFKSEIRIGDSRFEISVSAISDGDASIGAVVEWKDVTRAHLQQALLGTINTRMLVANIAPNGTLVSINQPFADLLGLVPEEAVGQPLAEVFADLTVADGDKRVSVMSKIAEGEAVFGKFELRPPSGAKCWTDGSFSPVLSSEGQLLQLLFLGTDITEAKAVIDAAERSRSEMQRAQSEVVEALRVGLNALSDGNLVQGIERAFSDDYEGLRIDFNAAQDRLRTAMCQVTELAQSIAAEAGEITDAARDLSVRTEKQAATLEETAVALDQLTNSVRVTAEGAARASDVVSEARSSAEKSGEVVRQAVTAMGEIESSSSQISKIINVIDEIAFQTNLLALNAGVEAARAGDAGRGFAVVASEVRALAQRSSDAAREINGLISTSTDQVARGVDLVGHAGQELDQIVENVANITEHVSEIAVSAQEQSAGLGEINAAVAQLDQVTQQNAAMFEEANAASNALTREAETLAKTMGRFQTGNASTRKGLAAADATGRDTRQGLSTTAPSGVPPGHGQAASSARIAGG